MKRFLNKVDIFIYKRDRQDQLKDIITFMIPISQEEEEKAILALKVDDDIRLDNNLFIKNKNVIILGTTDEIPAEVANTLPFEFMWFNLIVNYDTREIQVNDNGLPSMSQHYNKKTLIKIGVSMLGNPERILVARMNYSSYIGSNFHNSITKSIK